MLLCSQVGSARCRVWCCCSFTLSFLDRQVPKYTCCVFVTCGIPKQHRLLFQDLKQDPPIEQYY